MKRDITAIEDIKLLVDSFYQKALQDKQLGYIFNDIAKVNWEHHLPVMYKFWASTLLGEVGYTGNPMDAHFRLNEKVPLTHEAFNSWKNIFVETVDEFFEGTIANDAKKKAVSLADLMFYKIQNYNQSPGLNIGKVRRD